MANDFTLKAISISLLFLYPPPPPRSTGGWQRFPRNTVSLSPTFDQSVEPLTISHNRISKRVESAKRLHRYLNFADDGNHARSTLQLHVSSGFCASVTLRSGVTQRGGQDRVLFVNLYPQPSHRYVFIPPIRPSFLLVSVN